jgi:FkbM family methyltransferase
MPFRLRSLLERISQHQNRRCAAAALGLQFRSSGAFEVPSKIRIAGTEREVRIPTDHGSKVAFIDIFLDDCYGLRAFPAEVAAVLDIGAHAGLFSLAARMRFPEAQIHAYEPNPEMHSYLAQQAAVASFSYFGEAVGLSECRVTLDFGEDSVQTRVVHDPHSAIKCTSFSEAVARLSKVPILVKLDCEGAEWEILQDTVTWQDVRFLTMEYHLWAGYTLAELRRRIESMGFVIKSLVNTGEKFGILIAQKV